MPNFYSGQGVFSPIPTIGNVLLKIFTSDVLAHRPAADGTKGFYFATDTGNFYADNQGTWVSIGSASGFLSAGTLWNYKANAVATSGYPGDGKVLWDNATQTLATHLSFSHLTNDNLDIDHILGMVASGSKLLVQDVANSANYQLWSVTSAGINTNPGTATSYWKFLVTLLTSGGTGTTGFPDGTSLFVVTFPGGGGTGNSLTFNAAGSEPGSPNVGDANFPSNGFVMNDWDGSSWTNRNFGPIYPCKFPPVVANWTWVNQGAATVTQMTNGGIFMYAPAAASVQFRAQVRNIGSFTSCQGFILPNFGSSTTLRCGTGLCLRESGTGKVCIFIYYNTNGGPEIYVQYGPAFNNITTTHLSAFLPVVNCFPMMLRIDPTGTNMIFYVSSDGQNWISIDSLAKATPFTTAPDQWGWTTDSTDGIFNAGATLIHWMES
jgi:hypothetical protein